MYTDVILTLLTIVTGILTIKTFINGRNKDSKEEGKNDGVQAQKINDIDDRTKSIQQDVREIRNSGQKAEILATQALEKAQSAHKRIDTIDRIDRARSVAIRKEAQ